MVGLVGRIKLTFVGVVVELVGGWAGAGLMLILSPRPLLFPLTQNKNQSFPVVYLFPPSIISQNIISFFEKIFISP